MTKVLFSKMYIGGYNIDNIGHEIINFYKPDNCEDSFIFNPNEGKGDDDVDHVILLGAPEKYAYQILAIALNVKKVDNSLASEIRYGGKVLKEIDFDQRNIVADMHDFSHVTYQVPSGNLKKLSKKVYVVPAVNKKFTLEKQQMRIEELKSRNYEVIVLGKENPQRSYAYGYCDEKKNQELNQLIEDAKNFENFKLLKVDLTVNKLLLNNKSFMHFIGKEHSEQAFTNMIYNILNGGNGDDREEFVNWLLTEYNLKNKRNYKLNVKQDFEVAKEKSTSDTSHKGRLDLLLYNEDYIVIIENKINSLLNGIYEEENVKYSQLDKYEEFAKKLKTNNERLKNAKILTFLFVPNYSEIYELKDSECVIIKYNDLYLYFKNKQSNIPSSYYDEFLNGLLLHSLTREQEINRRFLNALNK